MAVFKPLIFVEYQVAADNPRVLQRASGVVPQSAGMLSAQSTADISMNHQLISDAEAKALSRRLADLGNHIEAFEEELASRGYGKPAL